jgi:hypothetical protein
MRHNTTSRKVAGLIPDHVVGFFNLTQSFQPHYSTGVVLAANGSEYQESFWG